jgi:predicted RNA-binding Zn-ribbon protein involved in translation (DUF1610 family)
VKDDFAKVTSSAPSSNEKVSDTIARTFPCGSCGGAMAFQLHVQELACPFCGKVKVLSTADGSTEPKDFDVSQNERDLVEALTRHKAEKPIQLEQKQLDCKSCGAKVQFEGNLVALECSFCGSSMQRADVHDCSDRFTVDGVLPFSVEKSSAHEKLRSWVKSRWFAPNEFLKRGVEGRFEGLYASYFSFDALTFTAFSGERGQHYFVEVGSGQNQSKERRTRFVPVSGNFQRFFDDLLVCACAPLSRGLANQLGPWPLEKCRPFDHSLLAGFKTLTYDLELKQCFDEANQKMETLLRQEVLDKIGGDVQRIHSLQVHKDALKFKHLLLPLWIMTYRYQNKSFRIIVNAVTGEVQGDRPWSVVKILAAAFLAGLVAILLQRFGLLDEIIR